MALTTRNEIREIIETDWRETLQEARYIEDALGELADSLIPVYTSERIAEWVELPNDFTDCGSDLCVPEDGIVQRMTCDLYEYYRQTVESVWREIEEEHTCEKPATVSIESARFTGSAVATCSDCAFVSSLWDCACELEHDCADHQTAN